jgi:hypothetical protein
MSSHIDVDATLHTLVVMRRQEETGYAVTDYLSQIPAGTALEAPVDAACRQAMTKWCVEITDFCKYSRETAFIAISCLDRFMCNDKSVLLNRHQFQLAAMTALYTAAKIHEHEAMDPDLVSTLSRGAHSPQAVEAMEYRMLNAIQWRVNPPTAMSFVRKMLDLVPAHLMNAFERETIVELAQLQVDLTLTDYKFCQCSALSIGFASFLNAFENVTTGDIYHYANFETTMSEALPIDLNTIRDIRINLYEAVNGPEAMDMEITTVNDDKKIGTYYGNGTQAVSA